MTEELERLHKAAIKDLFLVTTEAQLDEFMIKYFDRKKGKLIGLPGEEAENIRKEIWRLSDQKRRWITNQ
jgi:hypothetical protein